MNGRRGRATAVAAVLLVALGLVLAGLAFWTTVGSGSTPAAVAGLTSPAPSATSPSSGVARIAWTQVTLDPPSPAVDAEVTYVVERSPAGAGTWAYVCGTGTTPLANDELDCEDAPPATNTYDYRVTGRLRSWTSAGVVSVWVTVDTTPPASAVTFPTAAGVYSATTWAAGCVASVCGTASDAGDSGLQEVEVSLRQGSGPYWDGSSFASAAPVWHVASGTSTWSYGFPAASFPVDGAYAVSSRATDNASNVESPTPSVTFTVDTTPPTVSASTLAATVGTSVAGFVEQGTGYRVYADVTDANAVSLVTADVSSVTSGETAVPLVPCVSACTVSGHTYSYASSTLTAGTPLSEGARSYSVRGTDGVGNASVPTSAAVVVDNTGPAITPVIAATTGTSPQGFVRQGATYRVYANVTDLPVGGASGVDPAGVSANVTNVTSGQTAVALIACGACGPASAYAFASGVLVASSPLTEGSRAFTVSARDNLATATSATGSLQVDNTAPTVSAVVAATTGTSPQGFVKQAGTYRAYANASDSGAGIDPAGLTADVSAITAGQSAAPLTACGACGPGSAYAYASAVLTADGTLPESSRAFTVSARDELGTTASTSGSVRADNTAPAVATVLANTTTNEPGWLAQGSGYRVYANATDLPLGPGAASGLVASSITADVSGITSGQTAVPLTAVGCPCVVGGTSYAYRTAVLTAGSPLAAGSRSFSTQASDSLGSTTISGASAIVDNTAPALAALQMFDADADGRVDRVTATFDETLLAYTAGNAPWTLANASGGAANTLASVAVASPVATLTLNEGVVNTAAGSFTVALAANANGIRDRAGNQSSFGPTAVADRAAPVPTNVVMANVQTLGRARARDTLTVTYSEALDASSLCSTWSNGSTQTISGNGVVDVLITNAGGNDVLSIANVGANCGGATNFRFGSVALGANYVASNTTFSGNGANQGVLTWNPTARTLTITLGGGNGSQTNVPASTSVYTPSALLEDLVTPPNAMTATAFSAPATSRF